MQRQRSSSLKNIKKDNENKFISTNKNFYKLFNESEQKAISTLFESDEDLNTFKQKIGILESRNSYAEKLFEKEIKDLKKMANEKDGQIKNLNLKIHEYEVKIKILENQLKESKINKKNITEKQEEKKFNVQEQLKEFGFSQNIKNKNEQIEKLNAIINNLREQINREHIEKSKEKELSKIQKELGIIEIFDLKNVLTDKTKKFLQTYLKITKKEVQIYIKGNNKSNRGNNSIDKYNNKNNDHKKVYSIYGAKNINDNKKLKNNINTKVPSLSLKKGGKK
jgi:hypothetical protein